MKTSEYGYWIQPSSVGLAADYPVSANHTRYLINNARHLIDESTQTRISWVSPVSTITDPALTYTSWTAGQTDWKRILTHIFPISMVGYDLEQGASSTIGGYTRPVHLVVKVGVASSGLVQLNVRAVLQDLYTSVDSDLSDDGCLAVFSGSTTNGSSTWVIDGTTLDEYPADIGSRLSKCRELGLTEYDSEYYKVSMRFMRLTIYAKDGNPSGLASLRGVYVREYQS